MIAKRFMEASSNKKKKQIEYKSFAQAMIPYWVEQKIAISISPLDCLKVRLVKKKKFCAYLKKKIWNKNKQANRFKHVNLIAKTNVLLLLVLFLILKQSYLVLLLRLSSSR